MHLEKFFRLTSKCPTCGDRGFYRFEGEKFDCDCEVQRLLYKHYLAANIPSLYHDICVDKHFVGADRKTVIEAVTNYLEHFEDYQHFGLGLTFSGWLGSGKTFAMTSILKSLLQQGYEVYFITFSELINVWGSSWSDEKSKRLLNDRLLSAEVLGLDELRTDARNNGGFLAGGLDDVIRHRTANRLPTLITTNMLPQQEEDEFEKVFSLLSESNERVIFTGKDLRPDTIAETTHTLAKRGERRPIC